MSPLTVPQAIGRVLVECGIDMTFVPGQQYVDHDGLYDCCSEIRSVLVRHESLAGVMAEVYGRLTGKPCGYRSGFRCPTPCSASWRPVS
jgi:acetolactate synthase-1/2/3 large subunit